MADKDDDRQTDQLPGNEPEAEADNEPEFQDADDIALAEAIAAAEAEEAAAVGEGEDDPDKAADPDKPGGDPQTGEEGTPADTDPDGGKGEGQPEGKASPMIPKARFDEVNSEVARLREQLAYQQGVIEASQRQAPPTGDTPQAEAPKSPEERLAEVRGQKQTLAAKYDEGELSYAELTAEMDKLADAEDAIRAERLQPKEQAAPANGGDDLYLEERTTQLEDQHPYALEIKSQADWDFIGKKAVEELRAEGVTLTNDARGDLVLRERMAKLTDRYGPMLTGKDLSKSTGQEQTTQPGGLSAQAEARKQKLAEADGHPPDLSNSGSPGTPTEYTDDKVEGMSMEEIGDLPQSTRDRLLGRR